MPNYANGKVYMIESLSSGLVYYGSTTQPLYKRFGAHKARMKTRNCSSKQVLIYDDAKIVLIELVGCESKEELLAREAHYIRNNECVNKQIPGRTKQEYRAIYNELNIDSIREHQKAYEELNKDSIKEYRKTYRDANKDRNKEYAELNKDSIKEYLKQYRIDNKETIKEKRGIKTVCVCGGKYTKQNESTHLKSKKHINFTLTQQ